MRFFFLLLAVLLGCAKADADLIVGSMTDISTGALSTITDANGLGIDLQSSFSGGVTSGGASVDFAGFGIGGTATTFGWEFTQTAGATHTSDIVYRIDALNGTFDAQIGFEKNIGSTLDFLSFRSDGVWSNISPTLTLAGDTVSSNGGFLSFTSGDPGGAFNPIVTGATFIEFANDPQFVAFSSGDQQFDLNLLAAAPTSIPESGSFLLLSFITLGLAMRRYRCD